MPTRVLEGTSSFSVQVRNTNREEDPKLSAKEMNQVEANIDLNQVVGGENQTEEEKQITE